MYGEAGGGILALSGSVNYSEKPLRYDISAKTDRIRIRYPEGSAGWLGDRCGSRARWTGVYSPGK